MPQPWHFGDVWNLAISSQGHLYVVDALRIQKFDLEGHYITEFGKLSNPQDDPQWVPTDIGIDSQEHVYVTYSNLISDNDSSSPTIRRIGYKYRNRNFLLFSFAPRPLGEGVRGKYCRISASVLMIRKFDAYGTEMVSKKWTAFNQTLSPDNMGGLAIDRQDNVYLIYPHDQLQKRTPEGQLLDQWPRPLGVAWESGIVIGTDSIYTVAD